MQDVLEIHLCLQQRLGQLESDRHRVAEGIIEVKRRISILEEAMSWSPVEVESSPQFPGKELGQEVEFVRRNVGEEADQKLAQEHEFFNAEAALVLVEA